MKLPCLLSVGDINGTVVQCNIKVTLLLYNANCCLMLLLWCITLFIEFLIHGRVAQGLTGYGVGNIGLHRQQSFRAAATVAWV